MGRLNFVFLWSASVFYPVWMYNGADRLYRGSFILKRGVLGTKLERVGFDGGFFNVTSSRNGNVSMSTRVFVNDHLGSVRYVVDMPSASVVEANDYQAFGGRQTVTPVPTAANIQHFHGKEDVAISGRDYSVYPARLYNPATSRWISPDPMAEKYYSVSPYAFCNNNPVIFVDPEGTDVWYIDSTGRIVDDTPLLNHVQDVIVIVGQDDNGIWRKIDGKSINVPYGTISQSDKRISKFTIKNNHFAKEIFEMLATGTDVEWSLVTYNNSDDAEVGTSNSRNSNSTIVESVRGREKTLKSVIHSHPSEPYPSTRDRALYENVRQRVPSDINSIVFQIFHTPTRRYIKFTEKGAIYESELFEVR